MKTSVSSPTRLTPLSVTVEFSKEVSDFYESDVTVQNGSITAGSFSGSGSVYVFYLTPGQDGVVTAGIAAGAAHDSAGNGNGVISLSLLYDSTAPDTSITSGPAGLTNQTDASFAFTATESVQFECRLDHEDYALCTSPRTCAVTAGNHTFEVRSIDLAGNSDPTPASYSWVIDTTAPDTTITDRPANPTNQTGATFTFTATESAQFECQTDSGGFSTCASPKTYTLTSGSHIFEVRSIDPAGNSDASPAAYSWVIDTTAPDTAITGKPSNPTNQTDATFTFATTESAQFECQMDSGGYTACSSPRTYTLTAGSHTFEVRSIDSAGNADASPPTYSWVIDTTVPDTTITGQPENLTNQTGATFAFSSTETGASFECRMEGGGYTACTSPKTYTLAAGNHTFEVRSIDPAGNVDASPAAYSWVIDTTAPDTTITSQPANPTNQTSAVFSFTSTKAGASFECRIDNGAYAACTSPKTYSGTDGDHLFEVRSIDPGGKHRCFSGSLFMDDRYQRTGHDGNQPASGADEPDERDLLVHGQRTGVIVRVPDRQRGICRLYQPSNVYRHNGYSYL